MLKLAENIRALRKQRNLTQEQLAEVLGVTVGAVYKWEARLSLPELNLLIEMADFFDVSVDALLGYEMKDNGLEATVARLEACHRGRESAGSGRGGKGPEEISPRFPGGVRKRVAVSVLRRVGPGRGPFATGPAAFGGCAAADSAKPRPRKSIRTFSSAKWPRPGWPWDRFGRRFPFWKRITPAACTMTSSA